MDVTAWRSDRSGYPGMRNCSWHATVGSALSETVATVSLSTVPRLSLRSRHASGEVDAHVGEGGRCG